MTRLALPLVLVLPLLAACGSSDRAEREAPAIQEEAEALEDAASMLDEQRLSSGAPEPQSPEGESE